MLLTEGFLGWGFFGFGVWLNTHHRSFERFDVCVCVCVCQQNKFSKKFV
jgi:hypothetical protein